MRVRKMNGITLGIALTTLCLSGVGCSNANSTGAGNDSSPQVTVEYYFQALETDDYVKDESKTVVQDAEFDTTVNASQFIKRYNGFTHVKNHADSVNSVTVTKKGDNTLKLYYERNVYDVTFNDAGIGVTESYKYGSLITPLTTVNDTEKLKFHGWKGSNGKFFNFEETKVSDDVALDAVYSAKEQQVLYDFESGTHFTSTYYQIAERSTAYAHSGTHSYKLRPGEADNYLNVPITDSYTFNAVQYYSYYVYIPSDSFRDLDGNPIEAPELIEYSSYSIKRAFLFDTYLDSLGATGDSQFENLTLSSLCYDKWVKVTIVGTQATNGNITLRTSNVKAVWQNIMSWTKVDFTYDIYLDDITVESGLTSVEAKQGMAVVSQIDKVKKTQSTSTNYEKYLQDTYALYEALSDEQKKLVHNWQEFLTLYENYFQD